MRLSYKIIDEPLRDTTIVLSGHDMTIAQIVDIARSGARVALSDEARRQSANAYGLLLQGAAEGVPIYWFNRGAGDQRETTIFSGDPTSANNARMIRAQQLERFRRGAQRGYGPEIDDEALVRAIMAIRVNMLCREAASPPLLELLVAMLNCRVTPVVMSRGSVGEGDLSMMSNIAAAMVGEGEAYFRAERMSASDALRRAGLQPLVPAGADQAALISTNAYALAQASLLIADAEHMLDWADLSYSMALNGMNSSVTMLSSAVQSMRPYPWLMWNAGRIMEMIKGSYLFERDPARIIQDPESMRASSQRHGSAWQAWAELLNSVRIAVNSSDHNPAILPDLAPESSWELGTPHFMQYYVAGGTLSGQQSGYILSNANWDPYPLANQIEAFTIALANLGVAVAQRIARFNNPFFTSIRPEDLYTAEELGEIRQLDEYLPTDLWQELADIGRVITPAGYAIYGTVEDLQAQTRLKLKHARDAVDLMFHLLAQDLLTASYWMEIRLKQNPQRRFGKAPSAALDALRRVIPWRADPASRPARPFGLDAYDFLQRYPASLFIGQSSIPMPTPRV